MPTIHKLEQKLLKVLLSAELYGITLNVKNIQTIQKQVEKKTRELEKEIFEIAGESFNYISSKQTSHILFEKLQIDPQGIKKTIYGFSTADKELQKLTQNHRIIDLILTARTMQKLTNTYLQKFLDLKDKEDKIYTTFSQTTVISGRLSSFNPNLQNIPKYQEFDLSSQTIFKASKSTSDLVFLDYSQIELRVLASLSQDKELIKAFENNEDIHSKTARELFNTQEVTRKQREIGKTINFSIVYGISDYGLSLVLKNSRHESKEFIDKFFNFYSGVKDYFDEQLQLVHKNRFAKTMLGRIAYIDFGSNFLQRKEAERQALNIRVQGTAAEICKLGMVEIFDFLNQNDLESIILLQVHDEIVVEVPREEKEYINTFKSIMEKCGRDLLKLPVLVDTKI